MRIRRAAVLSLAAGIIAAGPLLLPSGSSAKAPDNFSLSVTPSPLVATVNPGQTSQLSLKIINNGEATENLEIAPRSFSYNSQNGQVSLSNKPPQLVGSWISFSSPKFSVKVGQWFNEQVHIAVPNNAGFSYSFALVIGPQSAPQTTQGGQLVKGSVAVFTLLNVNRPGAVERLSVTSFSVSKHIYEWLPATFTIRIKNTGNTIVQPFGNVFIQKSASSKSSISTLNVNSSGGYILPGTTRSFTTTWNKGFPVEETYTSSAGTQKQHLVWDWSHSSDFRFGHYSANLVAAYNDGTRDIPMQAWVSFWVIPWKVIIVVIILAVLLTIGIWTLVARIVRMSRRGRRPSARSK